MERFKIEKSLSGTKIIYYVLEWLYSEPEYLFPWKWIKIKNSYWDWFYVTRYAGSTGVTEYDCSVYLPIKFKSEAKAKKYIKNRIELDKSKLPELVECHQIAPAM